ncbi:MULTISPECIES: hypothetical protein [Burkholderia]|uniref:Uncharacterized protein n=2 Tax=Burkholderia contaminans TaxID=488447 RepID=A0A250L5R2_9BURK|nr:MULTISPECIES: hypothetical protein [Burkholderia]UTP24872.1 hypothetical protein NMB33_31085 [Burkholderia sp. FXe9]MBH9689557.1 hypothetical protein [Burkholderia contaminans]MBK1899877.1 hypothetical protein [Burkholderia contaminans]MBK1907856.1 hypothetical protein [Burkholderia contaminans]MBK1920519.1 hypothetical protein [Burkholderia contaminans]
MVVLGRRPAQGDIARMIRFGTTLQFVTVPPRSHVNTPADGPTVATMKSILSYPLFFLAAMAGWLAVSLLCWPVLLALQALTTAVFIPHPAGSYIGLGFVSTARLLDFPTSFVGAFSVPFMNVPLGFVAIAWWFGTALIVQPTSARYRVMVRGRPSARAVLWRAARSWLILTTVLLLIAIPFLRRYEIVTPDHLYVRHLFDWHERAYPLASLKEIHVDDPGTSRSIITWNFIFDGDRHFTTTAPDIHALEYLLSNTHASANFTVVGNQSMKR